MGTCFTRGTNAARMVLVRRSGSAILIVAGVLAAASFILLAYGGMAMQRPFLSASEVARVLALEMVRNWARRASLAFAALSIFVACGGSVDVGNVPEAGVAADASPFDSSRPACALTPPTMHRASAVACPSNALDASAAHDGAALDGSVVVSDAGSECITDEDCGTTGVCSCIGNTFGYAHSSFSNVCVTSNCG